MLTKKQFATLLNKISTPKRGRNKRVDTGLITTELTDEERGLMVKYIVRNRGPILLALIPDVFDWQWLFAGGYLYQTTGKQSGYTFVHTCEQRIR